MSRPTDREETQLRLSRPHSLNDRLVYSWYQLQGDLGKAVSAAEYIDDPDEDPIVLIDGMTKNFRAPAWRVCWVVGPKEFISALASAGSYLDGGASTLGQYLSIQMLEPSRVEQDRIALQKHFRMKRELVLSRLAEMGLEVHNPPDSTFYIWLDVVSYWKWLATGEAEEELT